MFNEARNPYWYAFEVWSFFFKQKGIIVHTGKYKHFTARFISRFNPESATDYFNFLESMESALLKVNKRHTGNQQDYRMTLKNGATIVFELTRQANKNCLSLITLY